MIEPPKKLIQRIFEFCAILALSAFLLRLAVYYILEIWAYLLVAIIIVLIGIIAYRIWKHLRNAGKW